MRKRKQNIRCATAQTDFLKELSKEYGTQPFIVFCECGPRCDFMLQRKMEEAAREQHALRNHFHSRGVTVSETLDREREFEKSRN